MKGLIFVRVNFSKERNFGIQLKYNGIRQALRHHFQEVDFLYLKNDGLYLNDARVHSWNSKTLTALFSTAKLYTFDLGKIVSNQIDFKKYSFFYFRYTLSSPSILYLLNKIKEKNQSIKIIADFPTFPYDQEYKSFTQRIELLIDKKYRIKVAQLLENATHLGNEKKIWKVPTIQINNGIESSNFSISGSNTNWNHLHLLAIGNFNHWHGLDRIINGIASSQSKDKCFLRIIGKGYEAAIKLTKSLGLSEHIQFFPPTTGKTLDAHFDWANLGVGTLAMHRKGVVINQSLKHREYAARGLSFVYAGKDPVFSKSTKGISCVEENEDPINIDELLNNLKDNRTSIVEFAKQELNWKKSIENLIEHLKE